MQVILYFVAAIHGYYTDTRNSISCKQAEVSFIVLINYYLKTKVSIYTRNDKCCLYNIAITIYTFKKYQ